MGEGILNETKAGSGVFTRAPVHSVNGVVFDVPGKKIGGWLSDIPSVRKWAQKISGNQLKGMAEKTGTAARAATEMDARYQIEGMANTGLFEIVYTSLCTAGLFFLGKSFASKRKDREAAHDKAAASTESSPPPAAADDQTAPPSWTEKVAPKPAIDKTASYLDAVDKSRNNGLQLST